MKIKIYKVIGSFLSLCIFTLILSSCGQTQDGSDMPEENRAEVEYVAGDDFRTELSDEEKAEFLEQEIKNTLLQADGVADAEVIVSYPDDSCQVDIKLIYDEEFQGDKAALEKWVDNHLKVVFANEENLILNINQDK